MSIKKQMQTQKDRLLKIQESFYQESVKKYQKFFYNNLSCFIKLFDNEAYSLRNAITEILGNIILFVLTHNKEDQTENLDNEENHLKAKKNLLDTLITRIYDKNSYSRSCVLGVLANLCEKNVIPHDYL